MKNEYNALGIMSGTSLDGLDLALCNFVKTDKWNYKVIAAATVEYPDNLRSRLEKSIELSAYEFVKLDVELGRFIAEKVNAFLETQNIKPEFIASHGHTTFHQPQIGLTSQTGNGATIAAHTGITTVCDFRTTDVAFGGQGAPLVPVGDELLFEHYGACLNLGGISNISFRLNDKRVAFDISPCNMALNYLANQINMPYDKDGENARKGNTDEILLNKLNNIDFYKKTGAKSLGKEWFDTVFQPYLDKSEISIYDKLRTVTEHISMQLDNVLDGKNIETVLVTGGGARNVFLIERFNAKGKRKIIIPDSQTIDFKEAIIFAFLGVLRMRGEINCLSAVTGAKIDNCGGCIYLGK
ncbi:MAG: anhydro-N-acetylmuramic acid kinase [Prevotellaceae bacterium]|jgi:anhydro-N-acetylmuramic acid kinase|nr:anhydro-N-acetylmuramic acid kinase [Prevotellaceae bacterium]